jgi:hypothetical protein
LSMSTRLSLMEAKPLARRADEAAYPEATEEQKANLTKLFREV